MTLANCTARALVTNRANARTHAPADRSRRLLAPAAACSSMQSPPRHHDPPRGRAFRHFVHFTQAHFMLASPAMDAPQGSLFTRFAKAASRAAGKPLAFLAALIVVIAWSITGPVAGFSDTWQLVINTGTTIATFLMVFLIQNTQNRDSEAIQTKLDELIRATKGADNTLLDLEELEDRELERIHRSYEKLAREAREQEQP